MKKTYKKYVILTLGICALILLCGCKNSEIVFVEAEESTESEFMEAAPRETEDSCETSIVQETQEKVTVYICGAVNSPGVYELMEGCRVIDAVKMAGGLLENASGDAINLAAEIMDGIMIRIPTVEEASALMADACSGNAVISAFSGIQETGSGKININTADRNLLCTLPGIGETRAGAIIEYREKNGGFSRIEDVMKVSGIKESSFQKIKEYITVQ